MKKFGFETTLFEFFRERSANELATADYGDAMFGKVDMIKIEEVENGFDGGGKEFWFETKTVDIFVGVDRLAKFIGSGFVAQRKLNDDAIDVEILISRLDCGFEFFNAIGESFLNFGANFRAKTFFEFDIFCDDGVVAVMQN